VADRKRPRIDRAQIDVEAVNLAADVTGRDAEDVVNDTVALYLEGPGAPSGGARSEAWRR